jgi:hypothetical protein
MVNGEFENIIKPEMENWTSQKSHTGNYRLCLKIISKQHCAIL